MGIIGRKGELVDLSRAWNQALEGSPQFVVIWGRRRVGKTYLLTHFAQGKRAIYFTAARQDSDERHLRRFAAHLSEQLGEEIRDLVPDTFPDWEAALRFTIRLAESEPLLVVIDEAPRLATPRTNIADLISAVWENRVRNQKLMLVLSGSAVAVMAEMIGPHGGLHRRTTVERRMDPFPLTDAREFLPDLPPGQLIEAYAACGGYPLHLTRWSSQESVEDNLRELAFTPGGLLLRDAPDILTEDLDWRGGYERVLMAMSGGPRRRSRIAGRAQQRIDYTLDRLQRAGYVKTARSIGTHGAPDPLYEIADDYLAFWFAVVRDDADLIEGSQGRAVQARTKGRWETHLARVFENACRTHAQRLVTRGELPPDTIVGRWWRDETAEIDVVGLSADAAVLIGECRWQAKDLTDRDVLELRRKAAWLPVADAVRLALWSRGGLRGAQAEAGDVWHFGPGDVVGVG